MVSRVERNNGQERQQARQDYLDLISQCSSHFNDLKELEREHKNQASNLEGHIIAILQEGFSQSSKEAEENDGFLLSRLEELLKIWDRPVQGTLEQLLINNQRALARNTSQVPESPD
ncbi:hypothetical protein BDV12DRAFT_169091 [Aspergillus spectabilis]